MSFVGLAPLHEMSCGLQWNWRAQVRSGRSAPAPTLVFKPVVALGDVRHQRMRPSSMAGQDWPAFLPCPPE